MYPYGPTFIAGQYSADQTTPAFYSVSALTGTIAAGASANSPIFSFRWGSTSLKGIIHRILVSMNSLGTGFTAGVGRFDLVVARAFTASDTGGTALTLTTNNGKLRTAYATTGVTDARISSTAALSAGTRTLDAQALANVSFGVSTATNAVMLATYDIWSPSDTMPLVLSANEGFIIAATVPATGTWSANVQVEWQEGVGF